jgi:phosphoribosylcarboxyaminoimidazole (NCAIR) mutase
MTAYIYQLSVAVPESLTECANHLAAYLGGSEADLNTYTNARYTLGGINYHFLATVVTATALQRVAVPSELPEFVDAAKLYEAMQALVIVTAGESELPTAQADKITAIIGVDCSTALSAFGLTQIPDEV